MSDLIAAIATAPYPSGVGILRLSGEGASAAADQVFRPKNGIPLSLQPERQRVYGSVYDGEGRMIDQGLAFLSPAPHSYTGEDTAEIHCHGSPMVLSLALDALFSAGARAASPGEFTKRAFLNGKLDLSQAEAVIDLIEAETPTAARHAAGQLEGTLARQVESIYQGLTDVLAHFYAVLDYPDEDIDPFREETIRNALHLALTQTETLLATYQRGRQITYGIPCAIIGRPNVGKSSLLNAMAGFERAIVTDIPGTTRDTIEERVTLGGVLLRLIDTAGLRDSADKVEQMGVSRSQSAAKEAELLLLVLDGSKPLSEEDYTAISLAKHAPACICILNKGDLPPVLFPDDLMDDFSSICRLSAATGEGLEELSHLVSAAFPLSEPSQGTSAFLSNERQHTAAMRARESLLRAKGSLAEGLPPDLILTDVEEGLSALGELQGRTVKDDITDRIFSRFCVGK